MGYLKEERPVNRITITVKNGMVFNLKASIGPDMMCEGARIRMRSRSLKKISWCGTAQGMALVPNGGTHLVTIYVDRLCCLADAPVSTGPIYRRGACMLI